MPILLFFFKKEEKMHFSLQGISADVKNSVCTAQWNVRGKDILSAGQ